MGIVPETGTSSADEFDGAVFVYSNEFIYTVMVNIGRCQVS
jgi:hypothetical protein